MSDGILMVMSKSGICLFKQLEDKPFHMHKLILKVSSWTYVDDHPDRLIVNTRKTDNFFFLSYRANCPS